MEPGGRYRLLETMRHFATERLASDGVRLDQAHLRYYTSLAVQVQRPDASRSAAWDST